METSDQPMNSIVQRRAHYRARATGICPFDLIVWKIPPHWVLRDRPKPSMQLRVELVDLSVGGMCLSVLAHRVGPDALAVGDRIRAEFSQNDESAVLDAVIVYRAAANDDGATRMGMAFRKLENTIEGRRAGSLLNRLIADLQRQNIKQAAAVAS
jgi:c-di-GMP-binding flagellar brake protein YcgR